MAANGMVWIAGLYVAVSPLLNAVLAETGIFAPLFVLAGGGASFLLAVLYKKRGSSPIFGALFSAGLLMLLFLVTMQTVNTYLYHDSAATAITLLLGGLGAVGLIVRENSVKYTSRLFIGAALGVLLLLFVGSLRRFSCDALFPVPALTQSTVLNSLVCSVTGFVPLLLPCMAQEEPPRLLPFGIAVGGITLYSALVQVLYPPYMLTESKNLIVEISKNMSFGRFFQRMEFAGSLLILTVSLLMILMAASRLTGCVSRIVHQKAKVRLLTACLFLFAWIPTFFVSDGNALIRLARAATGIAAVCGALFVLPRRRRTALMTVLCVALCTLTSCMTYREIDTFDYPLIVAAQRQGDTVCFRFRTEDATYTMTGATLHDAVASVNLQKAKPLDLSQLGLVLVRQGDIDVLTALLSEIQATDVHNSILVAVTEDDSEAVVNADFSGFHGISEYFDEVKSGWERTPYIQVTAFDAEASLERNQTCLLPKLAFRDDQLLSVGAVAYGQGTNRSLTLEQTEQLRMLRKQKPEAEVLDGVLLLNLPPEGTEWIAGIYRETGCDILGVYPRLARQKRTEEEYRSLVSSIRDVRLTKK